MFTPIETSIGALLLHQATSNLLYQNGSILGASELMRQLFTDPTKETLAFFVGMAASVLPLRALAPQFVTSFPTATMTLQAGLFTAGVGALVGWGTKVSAVREAGGAGRFLVLTIDRCRMDVRLDICFAAFHASVAALQQQWLRSSQ